MRMYDIILKKRNKMALSDEEIAFFVNGIVTSAIPDYQAAALCMAIWFNGMTTDETVALTRCMTHSGDTVDLSQFGDLSVDKHSTGGVGDKTSLIVLPIVASLGGKIAKMSGRGLGHTGGTVDKLESIPGMRVTMSKEAFLSQVEKVGIAVIGQTGNLTPADKKLYALRDVTATVDSIPLITSSIMSKKLASGARHIVLDVKSGSGAFMKDEKSARALAQDMVKIGKSCGRNVTALITNMDQPLGFDIGNTLEVKEAISVLKGEQRGDLYEICVSLASEMVMLFKGDSPDDARARVKASVDSGAALEKMKEWVAAQGGDVSYIERPERFETASCVIPVTSDREGYLSCMDTEVIGACAAFLGAGRAKKDDAIDSAAGIVLKKKTGDSVRRGDVLAYLHTNLPDAADHAKERFLSALAFCEEKPEAKPLIYDIIR